MSAGARRQFERFEIHERTQTVPLRAITDLIVILHAHHEALTRDAAGRIASGPRS